MGTWATVCIILISLASSSSEGKQLKIRGNDGSLKEGDKGPKKGKYSCKDGSAPLPISKINDGYCDCTDGSDEPGTSACAGISNAMFYCVNAGYNPRYLPTSMVDDGVCDCCDGSDESEITCKDTCRTLKKEDKSEETKLIRQSVNSALNQFSTAAINIRNQLTTQEVEVASQIQQLIQMSQNINDQMTLMRLQMKMAELRHMQATTSQLLDSKLGMHYLSIPRCIESLPLSEKLTAGGTKNYIAENFTFTYCPFRHVIQAPSSHRKWAELNCEARVGVGTYHAKMTCPPEGARAVGIIPSADKTAKIPKAEEVNDKIQSKNSNENKEEKETENPTLLGVWDAKDWDTISSNFAIFRGDPSKPCSNGKIRTVNVSLVCGKEDRIVSVAENGMCAYEMVVESIVPCLTSKDLPGPSARRLVDVDRRNQQNVRKSSSSIQSDEYEDSLGSDHEEDGDEFDDDEDWFEHDEL